MNFWEGYSEFSGSPLALQKALYLEMAMKAANNIKIGISPRVTRSIMVDILRKLDCDPAAIGMKKFLITIINIHRAEDE